MGDAIPFPLKNQGSNGPSPGAVPLLAVPRIARICALGLGLDELLGEVCREIQAMCGAEGCYILSCREDGDGVEIWRSSLPGEWPDLEQVFRSPGPLGRVIDRLRPESFLAIDDFDSLSPDDPIRVLHGPHPIRSAILIPLKLATRVLGVLFLHMYGAPRKWTDGEVRVAADIVSPILSAALERRRMEGQLRDSEARYRFLADNALDFISLHDPSGKILYASSAARRMLGYRPEELTGVSAESFLHPDDREKFLEGNRRLERGEHAAVTLQYRLRRKEGGFMEGEAVSSAVRDEHGQIRQVVRVTRDLTERKKMEAHLFEGQQLEIVGMLAGGVAHEFNNLLVGITGAVEMLSRLLPGNGEAHKYLDMIERNGERAVELTRQLLAYARQGKYSPRNVSLNQPVLENVPILKAALPASVEIRLDLADALPPVLADNAQLKQLVMSLCLNAGEAMPRGGSLTIRTWGVGRLPGSLEETATAAWGTAAGVVRFGKSLSGPCSILEVTDSGTGMDGKTLGRIFEPFFSTKFIGRGMGLAAVRGIVESHDGEILVRSEPGKGTTFLVGFPTVPETPVAGNPRESQRRGGPATILVADDEDDVREIVSAMLRSAGYPVVEARNGIEALELFRGRSREIDLVLLDLMMPGMTGEQAFVEMRRIRPEVRGLLASGYDESGRIREIVADGFGGFLRKPFRLRELVGKVEEILGRREHGEGPGNP